MRVTIKIAEGGIQNGWSYTEACALDMQIEEVSAKIRRLTTRLQELRARRATLPD